MNVIGSIIFYFLTNIITFTLAPTVVLMRIFGARAAWETAKFWGISSNFLLRYLCGIKIKYEGLEHIPSEPCVVVAKHQSTWETTTLPLLLPPFSWVLKKELMHIPLFGWALVALTAIGIQRDNPREALKQVNDFGTKALEEGRSVVIFPEGTRTPVGETGNYQPSAFMLAKKAGVGILPVSHNAAVCWPKGAIIKHPGTITIRFLPIIPADVVTEKKRNELMQDVEQQIEETCRELGG